MHKLYEQNSDRKKSATASLPSVKAGSINYTFSKHVIPGPILSGMFKQGGSFLGYLYVSNPTRLLEHSHSHRFSGFIWTYETQRTIDHKDSPLTNLNNEASRVFLSHQNFTFHSVLSVGEVNSTSMQVSVKVLSVITTALKRPAVFLTTFLGLSD